MRLFSKLLILFGLIGSVSCQQAKRQAEPLYFDVKGFVQHQIVSLAGRPCNLEKILVMDGRQETMKFDSAKDSIFWADEFVVFKDHDINKPVLRDAYGITEGEDAAGNRFVHYQLRDQEQQGVNYLKVTFDSDDQVKSWESQYREKNVLYVSNRLVRMDLHKIEDLYQLREYSVEGFHKLIAKDTVHYQLLAKLRY